MPDRIDQRETILAALKAFDDRPLADAAGALFATLGYRSDRRLPIATTAQFLAHLDPTGKLTDRDREALGRLESLNLLFQLSDAELASHSDLFDDPSELQTTKIESYLFFSAELPPDQYTRTSLATLVRAINKPLPMPALVLFWHGDAISIGIIHRRLHKRDQAKDVLEKITLIKDIACADPIRAHVEILNDFVRANLDADFGVSNFVRLHEAWQKRLGSYALSSDFYREISDWYFWAHHQVDDGTIRLPQHCDTEQERSLFLIRLLTRVIFSWFLIEKRLIPTDLFREHRLKTLLKEFNPGKDPKKPDTASTYYRAVLQNLFFGTLNMPTDQRAFREKKQAGQRYDQNYGITNLWRYESDFRQPSDWLDISRRIPFLNGGLFDCLDDKSGKKQDNFILDGFSDRKDFGCDLPNDLFFGPKRTVDLSRDYGDEDKRTARSKKAKVRGLIEILSRYKFTIEENTPLEEEIALDPELLGKVFENLLASYNEDTRTTARKALGAFYTPREIVSYMVDEALKSYLTTQVPRCKGALDDLFSNKATLKEIKPDTRDALIAAIGSVKILDPACGSGAFPMGALHRLVDLLQKLDPNNESWKRDRLAEAHRTRQLREESGAAQEEIAACDIRIADIEKSFDTRFHALDFARKLYLIESSIYGVDIQPIATQIAKLRFFISLVVDQKVDARADNLGVRPLPNLETRLVAADTLIPIEKVESDLFSGEIDKLRTELADIRHEHFGARSPAAKRKWREADAAKRQAIATLLEREHAIPRDSARKLAAWDPYDQNAFAPFFDSEWMFGLPVGKVRIQGRAPATILGNLAPIKEAAGHTELTPSTPRESDNGFDVVLGNPPYLFITKLPKDSKAYFFANYETAEYRFDVYGLFIERAIKSLLRRSGQLSFIVPHTLLSNDSFEKLRRLILSRTRLGQVIDIGPNVFPGAKNETMVFLLSNEEPSLNAKETLVVSTTAKTFPTPTSRLLVNQRTWLDNPRASWLVKISPEVFAVLESMERRPLRLGAICHINQGLRTGDNDKYLAREARSKKWKPAAGGKEIGRYEPLPSDLFVYYDPDVLDAPRRRDIFEAREKLVVQEIRNITLERRIVATYDDKQYYCLQSTNVINLREVNGAFRIKCLLSFLNSNAVNFFFRQRFPGNNHIPSNQLVTIPIPECTDKQQRYIIAFVDMVLQATRVLAAAQTTRDRLMLAYWERVLNGLVYELYFPGEAHSAGVRLFGLLERAHIPDINSIPDSDRISRLRTFFVTTNDVTHPLRIALDKLQTLDTVRIIEGRA